MRSDVPSSPTLVESVSLRAGRVKTLPARRLTLSHKDFPNFPLTLPARALHIPVPTTVLPCPLFCVSCENPLDYIDRQHKIPQYKTPHPHRFSTPYDLYQRDCSVQVCTAAECVQGLVSGRPRMRLQSVCEKETEYGTGYCTSGTISKDSLRPELIRSSGRIYPVSRILSLSSLHFVPHPSARKPGPVRIPQRPHLTLPLIRDHNGRNQIPQHSRPADAGE